jgi:hypothetical protein
VLPFHLPRLPHDSWMILGEPIKYVYQEVPGASSESIEWADTIMPFKFVSEQIIAILFPCHFDRFIGSIKKIE